MKGGSIRQLYEISALGGAKTGWRNPIWSLETQSSRSSLCFRMKRDEHLERLQLLREKYCKCCWGQSGPLLNFQHDSAVENGVLLHTRDRPTVSFRYSSNFVTENVYLYVVHRTTSNCQYHFHFLQSGKAQDEDECCPSRRNKSEKKRRWRALSCSEGPATELGGLRCTKNRALRYHSKRGTRIGSAVTPR